MEANQDQRLDMRLKDEYDKIHRETDISIRNKETENWMKKNFKDLTFNEYAAITEEYGLYALMRNFLYINRMTAEARSKYNTSQLGTDLSQTLVRGTVKNEAGDLTFKRTMVSEKAQRVHEESTEIEADYRDRKLISDFDLTILERTIWDGKDDIKNQLKKLYNIQNDKLILYDSKMKGVTRLAKNLILKINRIPGEKQVAHLERELKEQKIIKQRERIDDKFHVFISMDLVSWVLIPKMEIQTESQIFLNKSEKAVKLMKRANSIEDLGNIKNFISQERMMELKQKGYNEIERLRNENVGLSTEKKEILEIIWQAIHNVLLFHNKKAQLYFMTKTETQEVISNVAHQNGGLSKYIKRLITKFGIEFICRFLNAQKMVSCNSLFFEETKEEYCNLNNWVNRKNFENMIELNLKFITKFTKIIIFKQINDTSILDSDDLLMLEFMYCHSIQADKETILEYLNDFNEKGVTKFSTCYEPMIEHTLNMEKKNLQLNQFLRLFTRLNKIENFGIEEKNDYMEFIINTRFKCDLRKELFEGIQTGQEHMLTQEDIINVKTLVERTHSKWNN